MKKILLFSALALSASLCASAQEKFSDFVNTTFHGQPVQNGQTLVSTEYDANAWQYELDFKMTPKTDGEINIYYNGGFTDNPTMAQDGKDGYGMASLCFSVIDPVHPMSQCVTFNTAEMDRYITLTSKTESEVEWQFHVMVDDGPEIKDGTYKIDFQVETEVDFYDDVFTVYLNVGPTANGVDDITVADENAPVEFYTLSGCKVNTPAKGEIVIMRQGAKVSKTVIR